MIGERLSELAHGVAGQWLVDTLLVTAALMAAVLVLRRPVAKHFGAEMAYLLWTVPLARLFMPPMVQTIEIPVSEPVTDGGAMAMPIGDMAAPADAVPEGAFANGLLLEADWFSLGMTVWLCGAGVFLIAQLSAYLQNRRELLEDAVEVSRMDDIRVIEIAGISGPFAFGLWRRYIALPIGFTQTYNPLERELALAHERSHHRAGDLWANFAALGLLSLHWFNPVAWMAWRAFRFDQEAACDARVLRRRSGAERTAYARAIAKAATGHTLAFASPLNPKEKIVERLKIMKQQDASKSRKWLGGALIGTTLVTAMAMTATVSYAVQPVDMPKAPEAPEAPLAPNAPIAPVVKNGVYIYTVKRGDKNVTLRLAGPTDRAEIERMADEAEESRALADSDLAVAESDRAVAQADWAAGEAEAIAGEAEAIAGEVEARAFAMDRAERNRADAMDRAARTVVRTGSNENYVVALGNGYSMRVQTRDCEGKPKSAAFMIHTEMQGKAVKRSKVVTCGQVMPDEAAIARSMATAQASMAKARAEIRSAKYLSAEDRAEALREIDEGMRELRTGMAEARADMRQMRRSVQAMPAPPAPPAVPAAPSW